MSNICFVSYEIAPTTRGGAGAFIANAIKILTERKHQIILLLDIPRADFERFHWHDRLYFPLYHAISTYQVDELCQDIDYKRSDFFSEPEWRSYRFYRALRKVAAIERLDIVEFFDYAGVSYFSLLGKITSEIFKETQIAIRTHTTIEAIDCEQPESYTTERHFFHALERHTLQISDVTLFPSKNYFEKVYLPLYRGWLGDHVISPPPVVNIPQFRPLEERSIILFYGKVESLKGADKFVEAALWLLNENPDMSVTFVLAGFDKKPKEGYRSYRDYLNRRIPISLQKKFEYTGHISHLELEKLLPHVLFAVFPNYLESFGYAVHELYAAGVPLLISPIPVFKEYFHDLDNALFFDGTIEDLAVKMKLLLTEKDLRNSFRIPYPVLPEPLGNFYEQINNKSWIKTENANHLSPVVVVLDQEGDSAKLRDTIRNFEETDLFVLSVKSNSRSVPIPFLDGFYWLYDQTETPVPLPELKTKDCLVLFQVGDQVEHGYVRQAVDILARQEEISFVGCWKYIQKNDSLRLDTFPTDAAIELLPFQEGFIPSRTVMRTSPGVSLLDIFDSRLKQYGEISYLWKMEEERGPGVIIPKPMVRVNVNEATESMVNSEVLSYLLLNIGLQETRLFRFLVSENLIQANSTNDRNPYLELAELDLRLLLKKMNTFPLGWIFRRRHNFKVLLNRYLNAK